MIEGRQCNEGGNNMAEEKGFTIKDKRAFSTETGEPRAKPSEKAKEKKTEKKETVKEKARETAEEIRLPEVNFSTFILSLNSSALLHFGKIADPATGRKTKNLPMAKHTIDILAMLEEKTKGNLAEDEGKLLTNILYDLRMRYIKETT